MIAKLSVALRAAQAVASLVATVLPMLRQVAPARQATSGRLDRKQADPLDTIRREQADLRNAIRQAAEQGDHVSGDQFAAGIAALEAKLAAGESRIYRAMLIQTGVIVGSVVAILRWLG